MIRLIGNATVPSVPTPRQVYDVNHTRHVGPGLPSFFRHGQSTPLYGLQSPRFQAVIHTRHGTPVPFPVHAGRSTNQQPGIALPQAPCGAPVPGPEFMRAACRMGVGHAFIRSCAFLQRSVAVGVPLQFAPVVWALRWVRFGARDLAAVLNRTSRRVVIGPPSRSLILRVPDLASTVVLDSRTGGR